MEALRFRKIPCLHTAKERFQDNTAGSVCCENSTPPSADRGREQLLGKTRWVTTVCKILNNVEIAQKSKSWSHLTTMST